MFHTYQKFLNGSSRWRYSRYSSVGNGYNIILWSNSDCQSCVRSCCWRAEIVIPTGCLQYSYRGRLCCLVKRTFLKLQRGFARKSLKSWVVAGLSVDITLMFVELHCSCCQLSRFTGPILTHWVSINHSHTKTCTFRPQYHWQKLQCSEGNCHL